MMDDNMEYEFSVSDRSMADTTFSFESSDDRRDDGEEDG